MQALPRSELQTWQQQHSHPRYPRSGLTPDPSKDTESISTPSSVRPWRPDSVTQAARPILSQIQESCPRLPPPSDPGVWPLPHIHDHLFRGHQLPPAQPPSQQDPWATGLGDAGERNVLVLRLGCGSQDGNGTGGDCRDDGQRRDVKLGWMPHRPAPTGDWGQITRSLASDRHDLGAQTDGSLGHGVTDGQLGSGLTGDLQRDPAFLDPRRYAVLGLTAEPRPVVFRSHGHHQHATGHRLSMLRAPCCGHGLAILEMEREPRLLRASSSHHLPAAPPIPRPASVLTFSHCSVAGGFPPRATHNSSKLCPARTCPSSRPGHSMTGGPGGTWKQQSLSGSGEPIHSFQTPQFAPETPCFSLIP